MTLLNGVNFTCTYVSHSIRIDIGSQPRYLYLSLFTLDANLAVSKLRSDVDAIRSEYMAYQKKQLIAIFFYMKRIQR